MSIRTKSQEKEIRRARNAALHAGDKKFVPPFPCARGHFMRYVSTMRCVDCDPFHRPRRDWSKGQAQRLRRWKEQSYRRAEGW